MYKASVDHVDLAEILIVKSEKVCGILLNCTILAVEEPTV
jgi:hypothetical protein